MKWSKTRVIVTGAAGFIGSHLTKQLTALGAEIIVVDNFSTGIKSNLAFFNGDIIEANVTDTTLFDKIKGDIDYIFHFGAPSSVMLFNKESLRCFNETCGGLLNILNLAKEKKVTKVVFPSSGSVYGSTVPPQKETDDPLTTNLYGVAKLACERIAKFFLKDVQSVALRIFAGYGPIETHKGEIASPVSLFLEDISKNNQPTVYGDGTQSRDFVYIDTVIEAIIRSAENSSSGIINVGSGKSYTFNDVIGLINEFLGTTVEPIYVSKPSSYLETTQADITRMQGELGIFPIQFEDGLKKYLESKQENNF